MMDYILSMGVDALFTNNPDVMIELLREKSFPRGEAPKDLPRNEPRGLNYGM
jgi:hypothetical protein